jgi:yecA family protein
VSDYCYPLCPPYPVPFASSILIDKFHSSAGNFWYFTKLNRTCTHLLSLTCIENILQNMQLDQIFSELEQQLSALGADMSATESHGVLCARFCTETRPDPAAWVHEVIGDQDMNNLQVRSSQETLAHLYLQTEQVFQNAIERFEMMMPDEDVELSTRMQALVDWCSGFLSGLGLAGVEDNGSLDPDIKEIMQDFAEITRIDTHVEPAEENEAAFTEIEEYVRVGVMTVGLTLRPQVQDAPTIH